MDENHLKSRELGNIEQTPAFDKQCCAPCRRRLGMRGYMGADDESPIQHHNIKHHITNTTSYNFTTNNVTHITCIQPYVTANDIISELTQLPSHLDNNSSIHIKQYPIVLISTK